MESTQPTGQPDDDVARQRALIQAACRQVSEGTATDWSGSFLTLGEEAKTGDATEDWGLPDDRSRSGPTPDHLPPAGKKEGAAEPTQFSVGAWVGPYRLIRFLGQGSFGEVWLAERASAVASTRLAVKLPLANAADLPAVRREAALWARAAHHPNVLPIFEANVYEGQLVIVSEYAPDGSLEEWLKRHEGKAPSYAAALDMAMGLLGGLEHLHVRGLIHRDLKPANVLMQGEYPRIADFGLARRLDSPSISGQVAGTPAYMAPESFDGSYSVRSDVWAAGVILYRLLVGRLPFRGQGFSQIRKAIVGDKPEPLPPSVPSAIRQAVMAALAKDARERFASAADMRSALRDALRRFDAGEVPVAFMPQRGCRTVAVTGSMSADPRQAALQVRALAAPFCGPQTTWYCGTVGAVDEAAATFLLENGQRVIAVGYHGGDLSGEVAAILRRYAAPFVDALLEPVPPLPGAPEQRDAFFATKADLVIVLWNGKSRGTAQFLEWLRQTGKDHVLGFVGPAPE
jgi:serine/threonine-protein kinase